jgi:hypothetical protein
MQLFDIPPNNLRGKCIDFLHRGQREQNRIIKSNKIFETIFAEQEPPSRYV